MSGALSHVRRNGAHSSPLSAKTSVPMPELPEVEYTRQRLATWLGRGPIVACAIDDARLVRPARPGAVAEGLIGRTIARVERKGKWLRLVLSGDRSLFVHLAMTGWFEHPTSDEPLRHERARITVLRGKGGKGGQKRTQVAYVDPRRWGRWILAEAELPAWTALGPDPLREKVAPDVLHAKLSRRKKQSIKEALLDQSLLAGVGNIQAAEALWKAAIDPRSPASSITPVELRAILRGIDWTIARTLKDLAKGDAGKADPWIAYGHKGLPCPRCGAPFVRIDLGGRTTTFCRACQK
jgi:formamidopyrimidine-DNA glycosylase